MKRGSWLGMLVAFGVVLGAGCGGVNSLDAFKDRLFFIDYSFVTTDPGAPAGKGVLTVVLESKGLACGQLLPSVSATVNGDLNVRLDPGRCGGLLDRGNPFLTYELPVGDPQNATIVLSDDSHRMEVEVENLLARYQLQAEKAGFDPTLVDPGANPVKRGEVLVFDRVPSLRDATLESNLYQGATNFDTQPNLSGAKVRVTIPTTVADGEARLAVSTTEHPAILRCEGVSSCEDHVEVRMDANVTVTP